MANVKLTKEWMLLPITTGTIENNSIGNIEITTGEDEGLILYPRDKHEFKATALKARSLTFKEAVVRVVNFTSAKSGAIDYDDLDSMVSEDEAEDLANEILGM